MALMRSSVSSNSGNGFQSPPDRALALSVGAGRARRAGERRLSGVRQVQQIGRGEREAGSFQSQ
jgi:hypothetical protein